MHAFTGKFSKINQQKKNKATHIIFIKLMYALSLFLNFMFIYALHAKGVFNYIWDWRSLCKNIMQINIYDDNFSIHIYFINVRNLIDRARRWEKNVSILIGLIILLRTNSTDGKRISVFRVSEVFPISRIINLPQQVLPKSNRTNWTMYGSSRFTYHHGTRSVLVNEHVSGV